MSATKSEMESIPNDPPPGGKFDGTFPTAYSQEEINEMGDLSMSQEISEDMPVQIYCIEHKGHLESFVITAAFSDGDDQNWRRVKAWPIVPIEQFGEEKTKTYAEALEEQGDEVLDCRGIRLITGSKSGPQWVMTGPEMTFTVGPETAAPASPRVVAQLRPAVRTEPGQNDSVRVESIALNRIMPWRGGQIRTSFDQNKLDELADSIREQGVLQPILVRPLEEPGENGEAFEIIAGERRWRASRIAGRETIPAIVRDLDDRAALEIQAVENLQRDDLSEIEEAFGYQRLIKEYKYTPDEIARKIGKSGKSKNYIYGRLKLCNLPQLAMESMRKRELPASIGELIGRLPSEEIREKFWKDQFGELDGDDFDMPTYRDVKALIESKYMVELKGAPFSQADKKLRPEAGSCKDCPKRTGNNRTDYPEGRADICTDPACFKLKVRAHNERERQKHPPATPPAAAKKTDPEEKRKSHTSPASIHHDDELEEATAAPAETPDADSQYDGAESEAESERMETPPAANPSEAFGAEELFSKSKIEINLTLMPWDGDQAGRKIVGSVSAENCQPLIFGGRALEETAIAKIEETLARFRQELPQRRKSPAAKPGGARK